MQSRIPYNFLYISIKTSFFLTRGIIPSLIYASVLGNTFSFLPNQQFVFVFVLQRRIYATNVNLSNYYMLGVNVLI